MQGPLPRLEIYEQERYLIGHIDPAQCPIELEAVERQQPSTATHDIAGVQVAVAFAHAPCSKTARQERPRGIRPRPEIRLQRMQCRAVAERRGGVHAFRRILLDTSDLRSWLAPLLPGACRGQSCVKARELAAEGLELFGLDALRFEQSIKLLRAGELPHPHRVL